MNKLQFEVFLDVAIVLAGEHPLTMQNLIPYPVA
jgi:hypothetical protein